MLRVNSTLVNRSSLMELMRTPDLLLMLSTIELSDIKSVKGTSGISTFTVDVIQDPNSLLELLQSLLVKLLFLVSLGLEFNIK